MSTAAPGVQAGSVTLALVSDGSGVDGLGQLTLPAVAVPVSVTVDSYAVARLSVSGATLAAGAAPGSYVLDLGTVAQGSAAVTATLGLSNAAAGPADVLGSTFDVSGGPAFGNTGFGAVSGLGAGGRPRPGQ